MEQTRAESLIQALAAAPHRQDEAAPAPAARGEHDHDESGGPAAASAEPVTGRRLPRRHSVRGQVLAELRQALLTGDLAAGQVYSAPALADRYGVSPTPVREAMQRLASEGLVETVPNRGFRVVRHSARDAAELAEVRALLEIPTVLGLARTRSAGTWDVLRPYADATVAAAARGDRAGYAEADRAFHGALLELTGNRRLMLLAEDVLRRSQCHGPAIAASTPALVSAAAEHTALIDALRVRDLAAVERVLRTHLAPG